jgi:hypothetical protein
MKLSRRMIWAFIILGTIVSVYQIYSLMAALDVPTWIALVSWLVFWYMYFILRKAYLKKKGVDLAAVMSAAYQPWEKNELSLEKENKAARGAGA